MDELENLFTVENLTESINRTAQQPGRIGEMGLFEEKRIDTTSVNVVLKNNSIILVPSKPRGSDGTSLDKDKKTATNFPLAHLPMSGAVLADSVQNLKPFGGETREGMLQAKIDEELMRMSGSVDVTIEYHRIGALMGKVLDADGEAVLVDLFKKFDLTRIVKALDFTKELSTQLKSAIRESKKEQGPLKATKYHAMVGATIMDELLKNSEFKKAYDRYQNGEVFREGVENGVRFAGITWEEYDGQVGDTAFIKANEGILIPVGIKRNVLHLLWSS